MYWVRVNISYLQTSANLAGEVGQTTRLKSDRSESNLVKLTRIFRSIHWLERMLRLSEGTKTRYVTVLKERLQ